MIDQSSSGRSFGKAFFFLLASSLIPIALAQVVNPKNSVVSSQASRKAKAHASPSTTAIGLFRYEGINPPNTSIITLIAVEASIIVSGVFMMYVIINIYFILINYSKSITHSFNKRNSLHLL